MGLNIPAFWKSILKLVPVVLVSFLIGVGIAKIFCQVRWTSFIISVVLYVFLYCLLMLLKGMNEEERKEVISIIKRTKN